MADGRSISLGTGEETREKLTSLQLVSEKEERSREEDPLVVSSNATLEHKLTRCSTFAVRQLPSGRAQSAELQHSTAAHSSYTTTTREQNGLIQWPRIQVQS